MNQNPNAKEKRLAVRALLAAVPRTGGWFGMMLVHPDCLDLFRFWTGMMLGKRNGAISIPCHYYRWVGIRMDRVSVEFFEVFREWVKENDLPLVVEKEKLDDQSKVRFSLEYHVTIKRKEKWKRL